MVFLGSWIRGTYQESRVQIDVWPADDDGEGGKQLEPMNCPDSLLVTSDLQRGKLDVHRAIVQRTFVWQGSIDPFQCTVGPK